MNRFIDVMPLSFTALTPVHIGCGKDFEPTNYVIEGGELHYFDPAKLSLTQRDRELLIQSVNKSGDDAIRAVHRFFHERRELCRQVSRFRVPVARGVAEQYSDRIGQVAQREPGARAVVNQLEIERTAHHPHTGKVLLPGSSLKGSMRTGWLNYLDREHRPEDPAEARREQSAAVEEKLLHGRFQSDPFRLVDIADAAGQDIESRIVFAVDRRKQPRSDRSGHSIAKDLSVCCEVIGGGQFRALRGEIRFEKAAESAEPPNVPNKQARIGDFATLARACNSFYLDRFRGEFAALQRLSPGPWLEAFGRMIESLKPSLGEGGAILLRVGRHCGAESVTLDRRRAIRIMGGRRREAYWAREATTVWLAAERPSSSDGMVPFGWVLAEPADASAPEALERWCAEERKRLAAASVPTTTVRGPTPAFADETVWPRARLKYNKNNGTLTAIGPQNAEAHALAPRGEELLSNLAPEVQAKVRAHQFVQVIARIRGSNLLAVEPKS
jgi:CRISPR-associated protein Csm5